jgi:hypothetical protein
MKSFLKLRKKNIFIVGRTMFMHLWEGEKISKIIRCAHVLAQETSNAEYVRNNPTDSNRY